MRIGIVGYGARSSLANLFHDPERGTAVTAVCDPSPARRDLAREHFGEGLLTCSELVTLLESDVDAVVISSPDYLHAPQAIAALTAGKAVYVEKPLATTVEQADAVLEAAEVSGSLLFVGHNMRYMPVIETLKKAIDDGLIGAVKSIWCRHFVGHGGDFFFRDWHADRTKVNSLLLQKGVHDLDVLNYLSDSEPARVSAFGNQTVYLPNPDHRAPAGFEHDPDSFLINWPPAERRDLAAVIDVEDLNIVNLQMRNGVLATYQQCHYTPDYWRSYTVIGDRGRLENFGDGPGSRVKIWNQRVVGYADQPDIELLVHHPVGDHAGADPRIVAAFLAAYRSGDPGAGNGHSARAAVRAGAGATESLRAGGRLVVFA